MTEPLYGFDCSNWNGRLSAEQAQCLALAGFTVGVVRLSLETDEKIAIAKQQIAALVTAGMQVMGYVWEYATDSPEDDARALWETYQDQPLQFVWVDAEETKYILDPAGNADWLQRFLLLAAEHWPVGIYTAPWWWRPKMADTDAFKDYPLWYANYDNIPALSNPGPFGGWDGPLAGKQYTASGSPCGFQNLDLNVFDHALLERAPQEDGMTPSQIAIVNDEIIRNLQKALGYKLPKAAREALEAGALPAAQTLARGEG